MLIIDCCFWFFLLFCLFTHHTYGLLLLSCSFLFRNLCSPCCIPLLFSPGINDARFSFPFIIFTLVSTIQGLFFLLQVAWWCCTGWLLFVCFSCCLLFFGSCAVEPNQHSFCLPNSAFFFHFCQICSPLTNERFIVVLSDARFIVIFCHLHRLAQLLFCFFITNCHKPLFCFAIVALWPMIIVHHPLLCFCCLQTCMNIDFYIFTGWIFPDWPMQGSLLSFCHWHDSFVLWTLIDELFFQPSATRWTIVLFVC